MTTSRAGMPMSTDRTSIEDRKNVVQRFYDSIRDGDMDVLDELLAPEFVSHEGSQVVRGVPAFKDLTAGFLSSFPDLAYEVAPLIGDGDDVLVWGGLSGTHRGDFFGIPASDRRVAWTGCAIYRFSGDRITTRLHDFDALGLMAQIQSPQPSATPTLQRPTTSKERTTMSVDENKAIFHRVIEELWNKQDLDVADELFSADHESPSAPGLPAGPAGVKAIAGMFLAAFPDLKVDIEIEVAEGDLVGGRLRQRGTHTGPLVSPQGTVEATGKEVDFTEMALLQVTDGKISTSWYWTDMIALLTQVGVISGAPSARG